MNNYFIGYKAISNKDNSLRLYRKANNKRLYVSRKLIGLKLSLSDNKQGDKLIVSLDNKQGLAVNKQGFISLNKLDNKIIDKLIDKPIEYSKALSDKISKA